MPVPSVCPQCHANFRGEDISPANRASFGGETHYSRVIGVYDDAADATVSWQCPDCGYAWARTGELSAGMRSFQLVSQPSDGAALTLEIDSPARDDQGQAPAALPLRKQWWQFWK